MYPDRPYYNFTASTMRHCYIHCTRKSIYSPFMPSTWPRPPNQWASWLPKCLNKSSSRCFDGKGWLEKSKSIIITIGDLFGSYLWSSPSVIWFVLPWTVTYVLVYLSVHVCVNDSYSKVPTLLTERKMCLPIAQGVLIINEVKVHWILCYLIYKMLQQVGAKLLCSSWRQ